MRDLMEPKLQQEQDVRVHTITLSREGAESTAGVSVRDLMEPKLQQEQDVRVHTITLSREGAESTAGVSVRDLMEPNQAPARAGCTSSYNYFVVTRETLPSEATAGVSVLDLMEERGNGGSKRAGLNGRARQRRE